MFEKIGSTVFKWLGDHDFNQKNTCYHDQAYTQMASFYKLSDFLPYRSFEEETQLFINQDSLGFVVETAPLVGASEEMQKEISNLFQQLLPEESALQVLLWADPHIGGLCDRFSQARYGQSAILEDLAERRARFLKGFAFQSPFLPYTLRTYRCLLSLTQKRQSSQIRQKEELGRLKQQLATTLEMLGLPVKVWEPNHLLNSLSDLFGMNPQQGQQTPLRWNKLQALNEQLGSAETNLQVSQNGLLLNDHALEGRTYSVRQYPEVWSLHAMGELIGDQERDQAQIPCPFMIHYGVYVPKQDALKTHVLAKATYVEKQAFSPIGKFLTGISQEAEELQFVRTQLAKGERVVQTQFSITLFDQPQRINTAEQILMNLFTSKEWRLEKNRFLHLPVFLTSLPMLWGEKKIQALLSLQKLKTTLSTESANLLPLQGEWQGTSTPGMIFGGRRGQLFTWYPFDNDTGNYNACVVGRSGSGKSVFMQELMTSTLGLGGRVFVLDVGRSFEKTCFLLEGQFIEFSAKTPICLNPFTTIPTDNEEVTSDALAMLKTILILMAAPSQGVDDKGAALLEQAMLETWQRYKNASTISLIAEWLLDQADEKARDLGMMLYPYTRLGTHGRFFHGPSTVNLERSLIVVELEELKERKDLQAVVVQMMIINITNRMFLGDRKTPFHIVFDEAWDMLRGNQSGLFIETLARRLRKYRGSLVVGTQSLNDFYQNPGAQAAFDNSDWLCLLSQKPESIEQLKKMDRLSLSPQKEAQLKSVKTKQGQYAEVMISGSNGYAIGRLLLDPYSSLLYSTKAEDYAAVQTLKIQGYTLPQSLEKLLQQRQAV
jgi:conjugal transfer ATP-binding protein TraC